MAVMERLLVIRKHQVGKYPPAKDEAGHKSQYNRLDATSFGPGHEKSPRACLVEEGLDAGSAQLWP